MGFWIFMLVMILLIPITMIGFGKLFLKQAPGEINAVFGYRTTMSMKIRTLGNLPIITVANCGIGAVFFCYRYQLFPYFLLLVKTKILWELLVESYVWCSWLHF